MVELAIGLGIVLSLFFTETLGVTAGGVIVPGYIALYLHDPLRVIGTFVISFVTFGIVQLLSKFILIYGKRRLVMSLLIGFLLGYISSNHVMFTESQYNLAVIGNIIPGLIANWMDRQGVIRTVSVIIITATIVQLVIMIVEKGLIHV